MGWDGIHCGDWNKVQNYNLSLTFCTKIKIIISVSFYCSLFKSMTWAIEKQFFSFPIPFRSTFIFSFNIWISNFRKNSIEVISIALQFIPISKFARTFAAEYEICQISSLEGCTEEKKPLCRRLSWKFANIWQNCISLVKLNYLCKFNLAPKKSANVRIPSPGFCPVVNLSKVREGHWKDQSPYQQPPLWWGGPRLFQDQMRSTGRRGEIGSHQSVNKNWCDRTASLGH